jgi:hypothetical protein
LYAAAVPTLFAQEELLQRVLEIAHTEPAIGQGLLSDQQSSQQLTNQDINESMLTSEVILAQKM